MYAVSVQTTPFCKRLVITALTQFTANLTYGERLYCTGKIYPTAVDRKTQLNVPFHITVLPE